MTTTSVDDAIILPQSQGTGLGGEESVIDAAINGVLNRYVGGEYVSSTYSTGLAFQNHSSSNDTVEVGPGIVFVQDNSTSTSGERGSGGNPQAESSTTSGYDTELPEGHTYAVLLPTATQISVSDSTLNEVYVDIDDVTANNSVNLEHDGGTTASPGNTSLKIGETNPDNASADTRANDDASPTFDSLTVNATTDTDALNAESVNKLYSASQYGSIQSAVDAAKNNNASGGAIIVIDGGFDETVTVDIACQIIGSGLFRNVSGIDTSATSPALSLQTNGITLDGIEIDNSGSGDALEVTSTSFFCKITKTRFRSGDVTIDGDKTAVQNCDVGGNDITLNSSDSVVLGNTAVGTVTNNGANNEVSSNT